MALHRLNRVVIGVPNPQATADFYRDFNLSDLGDNTFATADGGEQLCIIHSPVRRLVELSIHGRPVNPVQWLKPARQ